MLPAEKGFYIQRDDKYFWVDSSGNGGTRALNSSPCSFSFLEYFGRTFVAWSDATGDIFFAGWQMTPNKVYELTPWLSRAIIEKCEFHMHHPDGKP